MLIAFHCLGIFLFQIFRKRKKLETIKPPDITGSSIEHDLENDVRFDPPVYRQRYSKVYETLIDQKWRLNLRKLVDFGCAEFGLFIYLKSLNLEEIIFVDIDELLLNEKIGRIEPLLADHLRRRSIPLRVSVFGGSVEDPDYRLRKTDVVTAIELIEHLYPDTLDAFPYNIFSFIKPKLVILTTPNADFNVLFRRQGFRHPDHKFEWSREQFEDWANNIVLRFPDYEVEFYGIGKAPDNIVDIGCCSQAAIFIRKDVLSENYISPIYIKSCQCDKDSPCKSQIAESKLLCSCLCTFCIPDFSVGVCTYLAHNLRKLDTYQPMDSCRRTSLSDTALDQTYFVEGISNSLNQSYNIFYKLIQEIDFPYETDSRSETERLLETFRYRIRTFTHINSRFYVEEKDRCEIPVKDLMYGEIDVSFEEVRNLLSESGYQIEFCMFPETKEFEHCIISVPEEMEDVTSSSNDTDGYSSKSSEGNESIQLDSNTEHFSDWDEIAYVPKEKKSDSEQESKNTDLDSPFDSGYLKTPSPLEVNQQLPQSGADNSESIATNQVEDATTLPTSPNDQDRLHLKKTVAKDNFVGGLLGSISESNRSKVDVNRVNELDRYHHTTAFKTFLNNHLKSQNEFKTSVFKDLSVAGTSSNSRKFKKCKEKDKKTVRKKDNEEPTVLDDAKSITNCIIQNTLNKIVVENEANPDIIENLIPLPEPNNVIEVEPQNELPIPPENQEALEPVEAIENGDLANNNRDNEGNNFALNNLQEPEVDEGIDLLNDNLEEIMPPVQDNANLIENNNDMRINVEHIVEREQNVEANGENNAVADENELDAFNSIARVSREALYDPNSEQDLLEDFDIPPQANQDVENVFDVLNVGNRIVLVGIRPVSSNSMDRDQTGTTALLQTNTNSFPDWLLQILGSHLIPEERNATTSAEQDESHFYCQGDGLGVHPSVIAVEVDEAEDADDSTNESSSNNTVDYAEIDPRPSELFDMSSLPEEASPGNSITEDNTSRATGSFVWAETGNDNAAPSSNATDGHQLALNIAGGAVNDVVSAAEDEIIRSSRINLQTRDIPEKALKQIQ